jgi:hypothetical protein
MGVRLTFHCTVATFMGLLYVPGWGWNEWIFLNFRKCGAHGGMILTGENWRAWRKNCPSATLSTISHWIDLGVNSGCHGERLTTNCLSHGTAMWSLIGPVWPNFWVICVQLIEIDMSDYSFSGFHILSQACSVIVLHQPSYFWLLCFYRQVTG